MMLFRKIDGLQEVETMLADRIAEKWERDCERPLCGSRMQEGLQQGRKQVCKKARSLSNLPTDRPFRPPAPEVERRLRQAEAEELERWAESILDAEPLGEVFSLH